MVISPSFELENMHSLFFWISYSFLKKIKNFLSIGSTDWEPANPVRRISVEVHYWSRFEFGAPKLILVISPSSELGITHRFFFFLDSSFFKKYSIKFLVFFSTSLTGWESIRPDHQASLYGALILVILEPKSYLVQAHKLQISPRHGLSPFLSHWFGCLCLPVNV